MPRAEYKKANAAGKVKRYVRADATGRNIAHAWVNENGGGMFWKTLKPELRQRLGLALTAGAESKCAEDVRAASEELERALVLLAHARDREKILTAVRGELDALRKVVSRASRHVVDVSPVEGEST